MENSQIEREAAGFWVLRAVQAAVSSGAERVTIQVSRARVRVSFEPQRTPSAESQELVRVAAEAQNPERLEFNWETVCLDLYRVKRPWWHFFDRQSADIHQLVSLRCAFSPIPVLLDGRVVNRPLPERHALLGAKRTVRDEHGFYWSAEASWHQPDGGAAFALPGTLVRETQHVHRDKERWPVDSFIAVSALHRFYIPGKVSQVSSEGRKAGVAGELDFTQTVLLAFERAAFDQAGNAELTYRSVQCLDDPRMILPEIKLVDALKVPAAPLVTQRWLAVPYGSGSRGGLFYVADGVLLDPVDCGGPTALIAASGVATQDGTLSPTRSEAVGADVKWVREQAALLNTELEQAKAQGTPLDARPRHGMLDMMLRPPGV